MTKRLVSLSAVLLLLVVLGKFYAKPLLAQVRAALVADIDTPGRAPYQSRLAVSCDTTAVSCSLPGSPVPAGKRLTITNVSGAFNLRSQAGQFVGVSLDHFNAGVPGAAPRVFLPTIFQGTFSNFDNFVVNASVLALFDPPDHAVIDLNLAANNFTAGLVSFSRSGYLVDCSADPCAPISSF
jgi:hypothetical protein